MKNAKEILICGLLYAAAITVGIVVAKLAHGLFSSTTATAQNGAAVPNL